MSKFLIIAPHCTFPIRDGGSLRSYEIARNLSSPNNAVTFLAQNKNVVIRNDGEEPLPSKAGYSHGKTIPALKALFKRTHYVAEKWLNKEWLEIALSNIEGHQYDGVVFNFVWTFTEELSSKVACENIVIDTHNSEREWFETLKNASSNPLIRSICDSSIATSYGILSTLPRHIKLTHVSNQDCRHYKEISPNNTHYVIPNGCHINPRHIHPDYTCDQKDLYFLGNLHTKMNIDALKYFSEEFWPAIKDVAKFHVFGSNPSKIATDLCKENDWPLVANASDEQIGRALAEMHYCVLPFGYAAGSKLKLLDACGRGIPILSTEFGVWGIENATHTSGIHVSNSPQIWKRKLTERNGDPADVHQQLLDFAEDFSWSSISRRFERVFK